MFFKSFYLFTFIIIIYSFDIHKNNNNNNISSFRLFYQKIKINENKKNLTKYPLVTLLTCTNRYYQWRNIINNYKRQTYPNIELLIIFDGKFFKNRIEQILKKNDHTKHVSITTISYTSIGNCLNHGIQKTKGTWIAKMDDDDYYGKDYITNLVEESKKISTLLFLKLSHFTYLEQKKELWLLSPHHENKKIENIDEKRIRIPGSTLFWNRIIHTKYFIKFKNRHIAEDLYFVRSLLQKDIPIYSSNRYDHCWIRRSKLKTHTWKIKDNHLVYQNHGIKITSLNNNKNFSSLLPYICNITIII